MSDREKLLDEIEAEEMFYDFVSKFGDIGNAKKLQAESKEKLRGLYQRLTNSIMLSA